MNDDEINDPSAGMGPEEVVDALQTAMAQDAWRDQGEVALRLAHDIRRRYGARLEGLRPPDTVADVSSAAELWGKAQAWLEFGIHELETIPVLLGNDHPDNVMGLMGGGVSAVLRLLEACTRLEELRQ